MQYSTIKIVEILISKSLVKGKIHVPTIATLIEEYLNETLDGDLDVPYLKVFDKLKKSNREFEVEEILSSANSIALNEMVKEIFIYHLTLALAIKCELSDALISNLVKFERLRLSNDFLDLDDRNIVHFAMNRIMTMNWNNIDKIANALITNNHVIVKGPKGVGKKTTILGLIRATILKKYPLLVNSIFVENPSKIDLQKIMEKNKNCNIILIITGAKNEALFPVTNWNQTHVEENLKFMFVIDNENKPMMESIQTMSMFSAVEIEIDSPSDDETEKILESHIEALNKYIKISYDKEILKYIVQASNRFEGKNVQPKKAIDLSTEIIFNHINNNYAGQINIPSNIYEINEKTASTLVNFMKKNNDKQVYNALIKNHHIDIDFVEKFVINKFRLSKEVLASMMSTNIKEHLINLESSVKSKVFGQDEAVQVVTKSLWRRALKLDAMERPSSFMLIGLTGTGKTWLVKVLAEYLLGNQNKMIRFDMSEYMSKHEVSKLIGSPPGYIGSNQPGRLTEEVTKNPYAILLFDEIEKAHPDIMNIFLQILDDGRLTDNQGKTIDFSKTIIFMTSNVGSQISQKNKPGFVIADTSNDYKLAMKEAAEKNFKPEFINRIDKIIVYNKLEDKHLLSIIKTRLLEIAKNSIMNITFKDIDAASTHLLEIAKRPKYNIDKYSAREIKRVIVDVIENNIIEHASKNGLSDVCFDEKLNIK